MEAGLKPPPAGELARGRGGKTVGRRKEGAWRPPSLKRARWEVVEEGEGEDFGGTISMLFMGR